MISLKWQIGQEAFVPFWIIIDHVDVSITDSFVKVKVLSESLRHMNSPTGTIQLPACDIEIRPGLVANSIPSDYLISLDQLPMWAEKIAEWFKSYPNRQNSTSKSS